MQAFQTFILSESMGNIIPYQGWGACWCVNCEFRDMASQVIVTEEELVVEYLKLLECINKINLDT